PDYTKKVHQDCPSLPEIELINEIAKATTFTSQLAEQHNSAALKNAIKHTPNMYGLSGDEEETTVKEVEKMAKEEENATDEGFIPDSDLEVLAFEEAKEAEDFDEWGGVNNNFAHWNEAYCTRHAGGTGVFLN